MDYNLDTARSSISTALTEYKENERAVYVLDTVNEGLLSIKVEPDIMCYLLYCYYDQFAKIQQTFNVAISWSGIDSTAVFCTTLHADSSLLHLAVQQFLSFYHHISASLVAVALSHQAINITLPQYHKATYAIKKHHAKAMVKDVKSIGIVALYCPVDEVKEAKETFLSALSDKHYVTSNTPFKIQTQNGIEKENKHKLLASNPSLPVNTKSYRNVEKPGLDFYPAFVLRGAASPFAQANYPSYYNDETNKYHGDPDRHNRAITPLWRHENFSRSKIRGDDTISFNSSSGYGSNNGTISHQTAHSEAFKYKDYSELQFDRNYPVLPPLARHNTDSFVTPVSRRVVRRTLPRMLERDSSTHLYYYGDIPYDVEVMSQPKRSAHRQKSFLSENRNYNEERNIRLLDMLSPSMTDYNVMPRNHKKPMMPLLGPLSNQQLIRPMSIRKQHREPSLQLKKVLSIPKLKSPFTFKQQHKKYFEQTTPTGVVIDINEGDITDTICDVIVHETNSQLHVTGELAWAVAKTGAFEIPKSTKLYLAMHGSLQESKVMVTPSSSLSCRQIIHVAAPTWCKHDGKRSRKLLYNTYKNIFNTADVMLRAKSIALPVIGLKEITKTNETYPFSTATEIMYQALVAFLKLGSSTLRHLRYVDNDPDQVNLIMTSIKPKLENLTFDSRFLKQSHFTTRRYSSSESDFTSDDVSSNYGNQPPEHPSARQPFIVSPANVPANREDARKHRKFFRSNRR